MALQPASLAPAGLDCLRLSRLRLIFGSRLFVHSRRTRERDVCQRSSVKITRNHFFMKLLLLNLIHKEFNEIDGTER